MPPKDAGGSGERRRGAVTAKGNDMERATKNVRLGLTLPIGGAQEAAELARAARACGYEELWLAEVGGGDAYAIAGALAVSVPGMRIGTAVVPAQTRTPMVHAMAALSLQPAHRRELHSRYRAVVAQHRARLGRPAVRPAADAPARARRGAAQDAQRRQGRLRRARRSRRSASGSAVHSSGRCRSTSARSTSRRCA